MKIGFAQINATVGDLRGNFEKILTAYEQLAHGGADIAPLNFRGRKIGVTICEDIWTERYLPRQLYNVDPVRALVAQGAEIIFNASASPFSVRKPEVRREMICGLAGEHQRSIFYCN